MADYYSADLPKSMEPTYRHRVKPTGQTVLGKIGGGAPSGYTQTGTRRVYSKGAKDYINLAIYSKQEAAAPATTPTEEVKKTADTVKEPVAGYSPTELDTGPDPNNFISRFGGNKETMAHSGLKAVKAAEAAGLSISEIQRMGREQGISFGSGAQEYFKQNQAPSAEDLFANQIKTLRDMFTQTIQTQAAQYQKMQQAQEDRMAALQQQMRQSAIAQQRPTVAGVKMAEGAGGTAMQIARRGVTGAFGRRGMRISGLNV